MAKESKITSTSSSNIRRGATAKRVVSVPIKNVERLKLKGNQIGSPPSDSWAWRKYGQKPIKGSPYPRAYYRCSSSKLCPARKQVEISRVDPTMLVVTYSSEHDHPSPDFRHNYHRPAAVSEEDFEEEDDEDDDEDYLEKLRVNEVVEAPSHEITSTVSDQGPLVTGSEFGWFNDFDQTYCAIQEGPGLKEDYRINISDKEMAMIFTMRKEEDESDLYADLGELPECSAVGWRRERWSGGGAAWPPPVEAINCLP